MKAPELTQIAKLPKWAREYICNLERATEAAAIRLAPLQEAGETAKVVLNPYARHHGDGHSPMALDDSDMVRFRVNGHEIDVSITPEGQRLFAENWVTIRSASGRVIIEPESSNSIRVTGVNL